MNTLEQLRSLVEKEHLPHALLLCGQPQEIEKGVKTILEPLLNEQWESFLQGNHPDIHTLYPEGRSGMHSIAALKEMQAQSSLAPYKGPKKVFILYEAERMLPTSSNALLKLFEEPSAKTLLILATAYPERLLPTVRSRCQKYQLSASVNKEDPLFPLLLDILSDASKQVLFQQIEKELDKERQQSVKNALSALSKEVSSSQKEHVSKESEGKAATNFQKRAFSLLESVLKIYRDLYVFHLGASHELLFFPDFISKIQKIKPLPLDLVEKHLETARLAILRGMKVSSALRYLVNIS